MLLRFVFLNLTTLFWQIKSTPPPPPHPSPAFIPPLYPPNTRRGVDPDDLASLHGVWQSAFWIRCCLRCHISLICCQALVFTSVFGEGIMEIYVVIRCRCRFTELMANLNILSPSSSHPLLTLSSLALSFFLSLSLSLFFSLFLSSFLSILSISPSPPLIFSLSLSLSLSLTFSPLSLYSFLPSSLFFFSIFSLSLSLSSPLYIFLSLSLSLPPLTRLFLFPSSWIVQVL